MPLARDPPPHQPSSSGAAGKAPADPDDSVASVPSMSATPAPEQAPPQRAPKFTKLDMPTFSGPLEPAAINAWLGRCDDAFFAWSAWNDASAMTPQLRIVLAGMKLEEPSSMTWWSENRDVLKLLPAWELFVARFKDRFIPSGWRLDALARFYAISQGNRDFRDFVTQLQAAHNALTSAGVGYTISDSIFKNHLLLFSNNVLQLRVRALPSLVYENMKVDGLINLMSTTWASLVAEGRVKSGAVVLPVRCGLGSDIKSPVAAPPLSSSDYPLPDLSYAEREKLRAAGGCYHCRLKPGDSDWKDHRARDCPGDPKRDVPARKGRVAETVAAVSAVSDKVETLETIASVTTLPPGYRYSYLTHNRPGVADDSALIAAVVGPDFPCAVLEGSDDSDDSDW